MNSYEYHHGFYPWISHFWIVDRLMWDSPPPVLQSDWCLESNENTKSLRGWCPNGLCQSCPTLRQSHLLRFSCTPSKNARFMSWSDFKIVSDILVWLRQIFHWCVLKAHLPGLSILGWKSVISEDWDVYVPGGSEFIMLRLFQGVPLSSILIHPYPWPCQRLPWQCRT